MSVEFSPLLPLWGLLVLASGLLIASLVRVRTAPLGAFFRVLAGGMVVLFLAGPQLIQRTYQPLGDQAIILIDESASSSVSERSAIADAALPELRAALEAEGVEVREGRFGDADSSDLGRGLKEALATVARDQLAGVFVLSDGQVDLGTFGEDRSLPAPVHGLLLGDPDRQTDRRVAVTTASPYGILGEDARFEIEVEDTTGLPAVPVTVRVDGEALFTRDIPTGGPQAIDVPIDAPGSHIVEFATPTIPGEITKRNNVATSRVSIIRDRLRVLLISGEPHAGERVWRNVLNSDPAVDLVHFTILKPMEKPTTARADELNLIPFPSRELFLDKLKHFNVVIFDRYTYRGVISSFELSEVTRFVEGGGAVLIAAGPELASTGSLAAQPNLGYILPAVPKGTAVNKPFIPQLTETGERHPITKNLPDPGEWGRWLRHVPVEVRSGTALLEDGSGAPLLVTDRVGEGRIGMLLSDHLWLWARGFDGGGPHAEFLRRLVHWLMAEPELEEEALNATLDAEGTLTLTRRSLESEVNLATVTTPEGESSTLSFEEQSPGVFQARATGITADQVRVETATSGGRPLKAAAIRERAATREFSDITTTTEKLAPLVQATGGGFHVLPEPGAGLPRLRTVSAARGSRAGDDWLGLASRNARAVTSSRREPALPRWAYALIAGSLLFAAWVAESGRVGDLLKAGLPRMAFRVGT
jgi:hypothetical protein